MKRLARLTVLPTDTKQNNFVLALVDYLDKEFKSHELKSKRNNSYVKVCLSSKYEDKYDSIVIDCMNGKMYLRGEGCKDKYFGRLSKYKGTRASDAYHCVNYNATRIINRINKIEQGFKEKEVNANEIVAHVIDLRKDLVVADLRSEVIECKITDLRKEEKSVIDLRHNLVVADLRIEKKATIDLRMEKNIVDLRKKSVFSRLKTILQKNKVISSLEKIIGSYYVDMRK
jgi:hypothetical protein